MGSYYFLLSYYYFGKTDKLYLPETFVLTVEDEKRNYDGAVKYYKMEVENFNLANEPARLIIPYQNISETYLKQKNFSDCKKHLDLAMKLAISLYSITEYYSTQLL